MIKNKKHYINQVLYFTKKITNLSKHLKKNNKDFNSIRSLLKIVSNRKKILKFIKKKDNNFLKKIKTKFKIR